MKVAKRVDLKCFHHRKRIGNYYDVRGMLPKAKLVIIFQYTSVSNQHVVHLEFILFNVSYISVNQEKKKSAFSIPGKRF